ncbi:hypothetical protein M3M33_02415, partial [Loigolactobacillus coryniformis]|uniref:hypothetical protein n=1 Tax=Loigolactobacillus coryniformis TaxID=1610 RepID=UPI00201AAEE2
RTWSISSLNGVKFYAEGGKWECRHHAIVYRIIFASICVYLVPKIPFVRSFFLNKKYPFGYTHKVIKLL